MLLNCLYFLKNFRLFEEPLRPMLRWKTAFERPYSLALGRKWAGLFKKIFFFLSHSWKGILKATTNQSFTMTHLQAGKTVRSISAVAVCVIDEDGICKREMSGADNEFIQKAPPLLHVLFRFHFSYDFYLLLFVFIERGRPNWEL